MKTHEYTNGEITIVWKPELCKHAAVCINLLPNVYRPGERPWIKIKNATSNEIINQVKQCPSEALTIKEISK